LATFDIFLFCFAEVIFHDFLLAAVVTAFFAKVCMLIQNRSIRSLAGMVVFLLSVTIYNSYNFEDRATLTLRN
jgi:hypothetical protein